MHDLDQHSPHTLGQAPQAGEPRPWRVGIVYLLLLGPLFFATYGWANWVAGQRATVPSIVFDWERTIPFLPWTIVPYWIIDLLYGISLVLCATRARLHAHVKRLLLVQIVAVACFILFPLRLTFERPPVEGALGTMFDLLSSFDQPFNQAPSLHVALLVVLWPVYLDAVPKRCHGIVHAVAVLIGVSVLTTWQHHFIDVPTGAWLGAFALWAVRERREPNLWRVGHMRDPNRRLLCAYYLVGATGCTCAAWLGQGAWWWLLWPAASLFLVGVVYCFGDGRAYCKRAQGHFPLATWLLFGPYLLGGRINAMLWTRHDPGHNEICSGVHVGSLVRPWNRRGGDGQATVVDLGAEIAFDSSNARYVSVPMLDLVAPTVENLDQAVRAIDEAARRGPVLVACALGYSRSAAAVAAWLIAAGIDPDVTSAVARLRRARPSIVLGGRYMRALETFARRTRNHADRIDDSQPSARTAPDSRQTDDDVPVQPSS